jgi:D-inositol-3-phosphate glycosyltransferase
MPRGPRTPGRGRPALNLAAAIQTLLSDPEKRRIMGEKARQRVEKLFSWRQVARQPMDFYQEIVARQKT